MSTRRHRHVVVAAVVVLLERIRLVAGAVVVVLALEAVGVEETPGQSPDTWQVRAEAGCAVTARAQASTTIRSPSPMLDCAR